MQVTQATFVKSAAEPSGWPAPELPEIAFCGRSNVGKSTLLNTLLQRKGLARVSGTPGRTRLINFFRVLVLRDPAAGAPPDSERARCELMVADLPGFGYAQVSKVERATWRPLIERYLTRRDGLKVVILLCDSRRVAEVGRDPQILFDEEELCAWLQSIGRVVIPVMTKADKLAKYERKPLQQELKRRLQVTPVVFSAQSGEGSEELWRRVERVLYPTAVAGTEEAALPASPLADEGSGGEGGGDSGAIGDVGASGASTLAGDGALR